MQLRSALLDNSNSPDSPAGPDDHMIHDSSHDSHAQHIQNHQINHKFQQSDDNSNNFSSTVSVSPALFEEKKECSVDPLDSDPSLPQPHVPHPRHTRSQYDRNTSSRNIPHSPHDDAIISIPAIPSSSNSPNNPHSPDNPNNPHAPSSFESSLHTLLASPGHGFHTHVSGLTALLHRNSTCSECRIDDDLLSIKNTFLGNPDNPNNPVITLITHDCPIAQAYIPQPS